MAHGLWAGGARPTARPTARPKARQMKRDGQSKVASQKREPSTQVPSSEPQNQLHHAQLVVAGRWLTQGVISKPEPGRMPVSSLALRTTPFPIRQRTVGTHGKSPLFYRGNSHTQVRRKNRTQNGCTFWTGGCFEPTIYLFRQNVALKVVWMYHEILSGSMMSCICIRKKEKSIRNETGTGIL